MGSLRTPSTPQSDTATPTDPELPTGTTAPQDAAQRRTARRRPFTVHRSSGSDANGAERSSGERRTWRASRRWRRRSRWDRGARSPPVPAGCQRDPRRPPHRIRGCARTRKKWGVGGWNGLKLPDWSLELAHAAGDGAGGARWFGGGPRRAGLACVRRAVGRVYAAGGAVACIRAILGGVIVPECVSCGEGLPRGECPESKRPCGHHCNHSWSHDGCDWCGAMFGEVGPLVADPEGPHG